MVSRLGRAGPDSKLGNGRGFWSCAVGKCEYFSDRRDGVGRIEALERGLVGMGFRSGWDLVVRL